MSELCLQNWRKHKEVIIWSLGAVVCALVLSPVWALLVGVFISLVSGMKASAFTRKASKWSLQTAVILLGFGMNFAMVVKVGSHSILLTMFSISFTLLIGNLIGRVLRVNGSLAMLVSTGTAICGGSAIAAMAPSIKANQVNTAVSLAVIFVLNGIALVLFPFLGGLLHMSQDQFGLWAALAIHDTSSVVGATAVFGAQALAVGTTVKLTRALWILPVSVVGAKVSGSGEKSSKPWFLLGFLLAALCPVIFGNIVLWGGLYDLGRALMVAALFFVGTGITRSALKEVGVRPLIQAVLLWFIVSVCSYMGITHGWIHL
jgi:uncharacterized integral membrane protein (TIGR00698 family)